MRQFDMTWNDKAGRWFKKFQGKQFAISAKELLVQFPEMVTALTKVGSYRAANEWWRVKQAETTLLNTDEAYRDALNQRHSLIKASESGKAIDTKQLAEIDAKVITLREALPLAPIKKNSPSLAVQVTHYLSTRDVSAGRQDNIRSSLEMFKAFKTDDTCQIDGMTLSGFKAFLMKRIEAGTLVRVSAYHVMSNVKKFIRWLYHTAELLERLPKNIDDRDTNIKVPSARVKKPFDSEMVSTLLGAVEGQQRLYYLLMLNCGMTQIDIAELKHSEVDWKAGRIIRQRSKTGDDLEDDEQSTGDVPTVNYKLWPQTLKLLKLHRSDDPELVLVSAQKTPLVVRKLKTTGKSCMKRIDSIGLQYRRLKNKLNPIRKTAGLAELRELKILRKTASSKLDEHETYGRYTNHFLGHSPRTMNTKHYVTPSQDRFDDAVKWLGEQFGY